jgi:hypothetical protein
MMKRQVLAMSLLASTLFGALASVTPALAATIYEKEANNTPDTAQALPSITSTGAHTVYGSGSGLMDSTNYDYYRVNIAARHELELLLTRTSGLGELGMSLYHDSNRNGTLDPRELMAGIKLTSSKGFGGGTYRGMNSGLYFIFIRSSDSARTSYTLQVQVNTAKPSQVEVEPYNNYPNTANLVKGNLTGYRFLQGSLNGGPGSTVDQSDYYAFSLFTSRLVSIALSASPGPFNTHGALYHDKNLNGRIDAGEFVDSISAVGGSVANLYHFLESGAYILQIVKGLDTGLTDYGVTLGGH